MDNLLWDKADASFSDDILCQINYQYKKHCKKCQLGKFGATYGIFYDQENKNLIYFIECICGERICYIKDYKWEEE